MLKRIFDWTALLVMALVLVLIVTPARAQCSAPGGYVVQPQPMRWVPMPAYQVPAYQPTVYQVPTYQPATQPVQVVPPTTSVVPTGYRIEQTGQVGHAVQQSPVASVQQPAATQRQGQAGAAGSGAAGFLAWLNSVRAQAGCGPVGWDDNLAAGAARNSAVGFGHAIRCGRRQNAGVGDLATVCAMWLQSPPHYAALVDPSVTRVGLAAVGSVWTFNAD